MPHAATCPYCRARFELERSGTVNCDRCGREFELYVFHRTARTEEAAPPAPPVEGQGPGEAVPCANHRGNTAVATCARCGDFICGLCVIEVSRRTFCPRCFEHRLVRGDLSPQAGPRTARTALSLAILGLLLAPCSLGFGGIALGAAALYFGHKAIQEADRSEGRKGRGSAVAAMIIGGIDVLASVGVLAVWGFLML